MSQTRRRFLQTTAAASASLPLLHSLAYAAPAKDAWEELFDGHGDGGIWRAEDGSITGEQDPPGSGNGGVLLTDRKFGDFELLIDIQPDWGICSGLFLRGNDKGQCIQMMVDYHDVGNVGQLYGEGTGAWNTRTFDINGKLDGDKLASITTDKHLTTKEVGLVSACTPEEWVKAWKINDWNTVRVIVLGEYPHITTTINDLQVCAFDGSRADTKSYDKEDVLKQLGPEGSIAVQVHGGKSWPTGAKCRWKNIKIRPAAG